MKNIKILILFYVLAISQRAMSQMGPSFSFSSGSSSGYTGISIFFSAVNVPITTMNIIQFNKKDKSNAGFGIVTGLAQIAAGLIYKPDSGNNVFFPINLGLGSAALITSSLRLFQKNPKKNTMTTWNLYYVPMTTDKYGIGISLIRRI